MRRNTTSNPRLVYRFLVIPVLVVSVFTLLPLIPVMDKLQVGVAGSTLPGAKAASIESVASLTAKQSKSTYQWNISDDSLPLISLPDHIDGGVDLSLTYSMGPFQFPLFQSLYYNEQAGKYILMVMSEREGTQFIDLPRAGGVGLVQSSNNVSLRFSDEGDARRISTEDGTVYTFAQFVDGELHCTQIRDRDGHVFDLGYTDTASLATITDTSGRTIRFSYTKDYVSSITQTWGTSAARKNKKTWAIDTDTSPAERSVKFAHARSVTTKRIPTNAVKPTYTEEMAASDLTLATIFGGQGAKAAANGFEPAGLGSQYPLYRGDFVGDDGVVRRGHLSYAMHLYGNADGTGEIGVYVPPGFSSHSAEPTPTDAAVSFYYPRLGNLTDVTLVVFHVANFSLTPEGERVRIGDIGGRGGSVASYKHSHIEFYRGNTGLPSAAARAKLRIDPVVVFGFSTATASR
ncbi:MAG: hypothetical protein H7Z16_18990 [Pyrinomonadaceae bacterium]|nr:hypothetical protein [Pyrinomonadaceae bacterium]